MSHALSLNEEAPSKARSATVARRLGNAVAALTSQPRAWPFHMRLCRFNVSTQIRVPSRNAVRRQKRTNQFVTPTLAAPVVTDLEPLFSGFADPTRLRILNLLAAGELCVCDVVDLLELPQPLISRHLAYLRRAGLVEVTRESKYAHYRLAQPAHAVHRNLVECVQSCFVGIRSLDRERRAAERRVAARDVAPCD